MESLWWYRDLGPWASMWFNFKSGTLGVTATPLQEKMARRAYLSLPGGDNNQTAIFKLEPSLWALRPWMSGFRTRRKKDVLFKPSIHVVLVMLHDWVTSLIYILETAFRPWARGTVGFVFLLSGTKAGPARCTASARSSCISSAFCLFMTGRHNSSEFIVEISNFYKSRNKLFNSSFFVFF